MADLQSRRISDLPASAGVETLTCQWCSVTLPQGQTSCPTCGSPGIPDESMIVPGLAEDERDLLAVEPRQSPEEELVEWWNEDGDAQRARRGQSDDGDLAPMILGLLGTGVVCVLLGALVAPILLTPVFENSLGIVVDDSADLRPLGAILGLLVAAFIGAIGIWVTAPRR